MIRLAFILLLLPLAACMEDEAAPPPAAVNMGAEAIGYFCMMNVAEHPGPKGQVFLAGSEEPIWFPSVRDLLTFRVLPGENAEIAAAYVSDTAAGKSFEAIDPTRWIAVDKAAFVIGTSVVGGMGASEAVPFAERSDAERFAETHGGRVVAVDEIGQDWIFGDL